MILWYRRIGHIKSQESHFVVGLRSLGVKALLVVPVAFNLLKCKPVKSSSVPFSLAVGLYNIYILGCEFPLLGFGYNCQK